MTSKAESSSPVLPFLDSTILLQSTIASQYATISLSPTDADSLYQTAKAQFQLFRYEKALSTLDNYLSLYAPSPSIHLLRGECLYKLMRFEEAAASFGLAGGEAGAFWEGRALAAGGSGEAAAKALQLATTKGGPLAGNAFFERGWVLIELGRSAEAAESMREAAVRGVRVEEAMFGKGIAEMEIGRLEEAEESFRKAWEVSGGRFVEAACNRAKALQKLGKLAQALTVIEEAATAASTVGKRGGEAEGPEPNGTTSHTGINDLAFEVRWLRVGLLLSARRDSAALEAVNSVLQIDETFAEGHAVRACLLSRACNDPEALTAISRALFHKPNNIQYLFVKAALLLPDSPIAANSAGRRASSLAAASGSPPPLAAEASSTLAALAAAAEATAALDSQGPRVESLKGELRILSHSIRRALMRAFEPRPEPSEPAESSGKFVESLFDGLRRRAEVAEQAGWVRASLIGVPRDPAVMAKRLEEAKVLEPALFAYVQTLYLAFVSLLLSFDEDKESPAPPPNAEEFRILSSAIDPQPHNQTQSLLASQAQSTLTSSGTRGLGTPRPRQSLSSESAAIASIPPETISSLLDASNFSTDYALYERRRSFFELFKQKKESLNFSAFSCFWARIGAILLSSPLLRTRISGSPLPPEEKSLRFFKSVWRETRFKTAKPLIDSLPRRRALLDSVLLMEFLRASKEKFVVNKDPLDEMVLDCIIRGEHIEFFYQNNHAALKDSSIVEKIFGSTVKI